MNATRLCGWIVLILVALYLVVTLVDFGAEYVAAAEIGQQAEDLGLRTTKTNLRFKLGLEFFVDIMMLIMLGLVGWWLTTQEVIQIAWVAGISLFVIFSIVIRATPVLPMKVAYFSPGSAFYGAKVKVPIANDVTYMQTASGGYALKYVVISKKGNLRVARTYPRQGNKGQLVVLDLSDSSAARGYQQSQWPITITGIVNGTGSLAHGKKMTTVPQVRAVKVKSGLPKNYRRGQ